MLIKLTFPLPKTCSPTYNISITHISVEEKVTDVNLAAIFDSGTSFTYLTDPAYTIISENVSNISLYFQ